MQVRIMLLCLFCMAVLGTVTVTNAQSIVSDSEKQKQWKSMENGPWDFAPDWYYFFLHKKYSGAEMYWKWDWFNSGFRVRFKEPKSDVKRIMPVRVTAEKKDDGYNLLDRYERLTLANSIYTDLNRIRYKVEGMVLMAQYATANDLFFAIDPEGWANVVTMKNHVGNLVQDWNGLVASNY